MQYSETRREDIKRVLVGATRCLNPKCHKPLKYAKNKTATVAYCNRQCETSYTPMMVYFERLYNMPFREVLIMLLNQHRHQKAVAQNLGVQPKTMCEWCKKLEIKRDKGTWV